MNKNNRKSKRFTASLLSIALLLSMSTQYMTTAIYAQDSNTENVVTATQEEKSATTEVNLALGAKAKANNQEAGTNYSAEKVTDGVVNRDAPKAEQSRWATDTSSSQTPRTVTVDLGSEKTFNKFIIEWERTNITNFKVEISNEENGNYTLAYDKNDGENITDLTSEIALQQPKTARFVKLTVYGYTLNPGNWQSVSLYEFKIMGSATNLSIGATATANGQEDNSVTPDKANDGKSNTRWASPNNNNDHWLQLKYDQAKTIQSIKIHWERKNATNYRIEKSDNGTTWTTVKSFNKKPDDWRQTIVLDEPIKTQYIRLFIDAFDPNGAPEGGESVSWNTVSVYEFETYTEKLSDDSASQTPQTAQEVADSLQISTIGNNDTKFTLPTVPEGFEISFIGADYEQIIGRDLTIYKPLTQTNVKMNFKVTKKADNTTADSKEYTVTVPGKYDNAGTNQKPVVIPQLAEWYGKEGSVKITNASRIVVDSLASEFLPAAKALADDYKAETGIELQVVENGTANNGDILFTKADDNSGLGNEGYIIDINNNVTVKALDNTGAYWSTRSILQILELNQNSIPKGITRDYPKFAVRGFMLDVARKPVSMETLNNIAKEMAYYKMNEFHLHLNDNLIFYEDYESAADARDNAYTGFRLESDIKQGGENKADLTNKDVYYTKEEFRNLITTTRDMGVNIVPEFDTPGHAGALIKVRPDLMLKNVVSGQANRAGEQFDLSEEKYEQSLNFVKGLWDEYLNENMFDKSMTVHIGTDEYYGEKNRFRKFSDDLIKYIKEKGYNVRLWGSLSGMPGDQTVTSDGVEMNVWNTSWANPKNMYNDGFELINTLDGPLYMVPDAGYYNDYLNTQNLYNNWVPENFGGTKIPVGSEQMLGSTFAIWNDQVDTRANGISEVEIYDRFADAVPTLASKNWGDATDINYQKMSETVDTLGSAPGINPYNKETADKNNEYMSYEFNDNDKKADSSLNNRDLTNDTNVSLTNNELKLQGGQSYIETPINKLYIGNTLSFDIKLDKPAKVGQIIFEANTEDRNGDYVHDIRIMDDGRLGFRRELYDYYFDYKLPVGKKVNLSITTSGKDTILTVTDTSTKSTVTHTYKAVGKYINRQTDNGVRKEDISNATFLLPLQRIGSKTNSIVATIDNVTVSVAKSIEDEYNKSAWTGTAETETVMNETEGLFRYAFDGKSNTIWHSNWNGANDKLTGNNSFAGEINLGKKYNISEFSFTPRKDANSGQVTKADLFVKANETDEWKQIIPTQTNARQNTTTFTFPADKSKKTFTFDAQEVQYIKFVAKESNDGWIAVSEFDVNNVPKETFTVSVDAMQGGTVKSSSNTALRGETVTVTATADKGYNFTGWYDAVTGLKVSDTAEYTFTISSNTALTAHFESNGAVTEYTVVVDGVEYKVKEGQLLDIKTPTKPGHNFIGFFKQGTNEKVDFTSPITENMTVESRFEKYIVEVTQDPNGSFTISEMNEKGEITIVATPNAGYNFKGWFVDGKMISDKASYTFVPTANMNIKPVFEIAGAQTTPTNPEQKPENKPQTGNSAIANTNDTMNLGLLGLAATAFVSIFGILNKKRKED